MVLLLFERVDHVNFTMVYDVEAVTLLVLLVRNTLFEDRELVRLLLLELSAFRRLLFSFSI